jgi:prolyl oligopeptidase PreP (S9A serine peptidase family)
MEQKLMIITYKRIKLNGKTNHALWLWGFNISLTQVLVLLMQYGWKTEAFAVPGGGEYGKKWDAGTKLQNKMYLMISSLQNI